MNVETQEIITCPGCGKSIKLTILAEIFGAFNPNNLDVCISVQEEDADRNHQTNTSENIS